MEIRSKYNNKSRCCYNQDAVVLFRLSNLGAFVFEFTLDAVIIKSAVVFAPIRYICLIHTKEGLDIREDLVHHVHISGDHEVKSKMTL